MLVPVKQLFPIRLDPSETRTSEIELQLPVSPLFNPRIFIRNTGTQSISFRIDHILRLGTSDDPLLTGTFPTVIVEQNLDPGELVSHYFMEVALSDSWVTHRWSVTNLSAVESTILHIWVEGLFEENLREAPSFLPIFT